MNETLQSKAQALKAIFFDVDGVLTDGGIIYDNNGLESKRFNVKDGQIFQHLHRLGLHTGVVTGRDSKVVRHRMDELKISIQHHGIHEKGACMDRILTENGWSWEQIAYIGDDINDLPILTRCGLSATPGDGHEAVKDRVDLVLKTNGGQGAFREFADAILKARGDYDTILNTLTA